MPVKRTLNKNSVYLIYLITMRQSLIWIKILINDLLLLYCLNYNPDTYFINQDI